MAEVEYHGGEKDAPTVRAEPYTQCFIRRSYLWGPDLSGTMDGAGGVGGLLAMTRHARGTRGAETCWTTMDLNGNVVGMASTTTDRAAVYDPTAFGALVRVNEPEPGLNPLRFSNKYRDEETELVYYGYRYYAPKLGKWISRDPIEEEGGVNLYAICGSGITNLVDIRGKRISKCNLTEQSVPKRTSTILKDPLAIAETLDEWKFGSSGKRVGLRLTGMSESVKVGDGYQ